MEPSTKRNKVVLSLIVRDGNFLLIRRKKPHLHLEWAFPGGVVNERESDEDAVVRETKEEVKLDVEVVTKLFERQHPNTLVPVVYFHCRETSDNQKAGIGEEYEISEIDWVPAAEVLERFTSDVHPVIAEFVLSYAKGNSKESQSASNGSGSRER